MASRDGRWVMVYNGEVYNFREIRRELEAHGHTFLGSGDSEVILEAFAEWGPGAVRRFVGMFAIALWCRADRKFYLLRDRVGVKPLYYGWNVKALMIDAFRYRMISDVPVGVFLSGGIDSSILTAILQRHGGQRVKTFTIGFDDPEFDESPHAERVARHLGTEHTTRILEMSEAMRILQKWGDLYDEPFGDDSGIPTLLVSQVASESVKVVLSADGGDELVRGYDGQAGVFTQRCQRVAIPEWLPAATAAT